MGLILQIMFANFAKIRRVVGRVQFSKISKHHESQIVRVTSYDYLFVITMTKLHTLNAQRLKSFRSALSGSCGRQFLTSTCLNSSGAVRLLKYLSAICSFDNHILYCNNFVIVMISIKIMMA